MNETSPGRVAVHWLNPDLESAALSLAARLNLPPYAEGDAADLLLQLGDDGLSLLASAEAALGAV